MPLSTRLPKVTLALACAISGALLAPLANAQTPAAAQAPVAPRYTSFQLVEKLQKGGMVMIIRHERTEYPSREDDYTQPSTECRAQRNLSVAGVVGAHENGGLIRAAGIPIERVITSPMCRSAETARYMFGVDYEIDKRLMHHDPAENSDRPVEKAGEETAAVISELEALKLTGNVALVSHGGNIFKGTGLSLFEGEVGVLERDENGEFKGIGSFNGRTLGFYVRMKQLESEGTQ